jgi:ADP-ribosylation factor related protein 1
MYVCGIEKIQPTIGMNLAKIIHLNTQIIIWDLGGQLKMRNIWERYYNTGE